MASGFHVRVGQKAYIEKECCNDHGADHSNNDEHVPVLVVAQVTVRDFHGVSKLYRVVTQHGESLELPETDVIHRSEVEADDETPAPDEGETVADTKEESKTEEDVTSTVG